MPTGQDNKNTQDRSYTDDTKRLNHASPKDLISSQTADSKTQLTLPQLLGIPVMSASPQNSKKESHNSQPIAVVKFDSPQKRAPITQATLSPATHMRKEVLGCASPTNAKVDNLASPYNMRKGNTLLTRCAKIEVADIRALLFTENKDPTEKPIEPIKTLKVPNDAVFKHLLLQDTHIKNEILSGPLTFIEEPSLTTITLKITFDRIITETPERVISQDSVMGMTAKEYMKPFGLFHLDWQWGHLISFTVNHEDPPSKSNLMVVTRTANTYEARITEGLKKAMTTLASTETIGHWELTVEAHRTEITTIGDKKIYLNHGAYKHKYIYVYTDPAGKVSKPVIFTINAFEANDISHQKTTALYANIFLNIMKGKSFVNSTQRLLDFSTAQQTKDAVSAESGNASAITIDIKEASPIEAIIDSEIDEIPSFQRPLIHAKLDKKRKDNSDAQQSGIPLNLTIDIIRKLLAKYENAITKSKRFNFITVAKIGDIWQTLNSANISKKTIMKFRQQPFIFIKQNTLSNLFPDANENIEYPNFVFEEAGYYCIVILDKEAYPVEILEAIKNAQENFKKPRISRAAGKRPAAQEAQAAIQETTVIERLKFQKIPADGHCFYHAVGLFLGKNYQEIREMTAQQMERYPEKFSSSLHDEEETLAARIRNVRCTNTWADQLEIAALQHAINNPLIVISPNTNPVIPHNYKDLTGNPIFVLYNGINHYDALLAKEGYTGQEIFENILASMDAGHTVTYNMPKSDKKSGPKTLAGFFEPATCTPASKATNPISISAPRKDPQESPEEASSSCRGLSF